MKHTMHKALEYRWYIAEAKWKHSEFKQNTSANEYILVLMLLCYAHLMIYLCKVNFAHELG